MPEPADAELAAERFASPFDELGPLALARRAAEALQAELRAGFVAAGVPVRVLDEPRGGKMFGVLVVEAPDGRRGVLRAFSGMFDGRFDVPGYAPPIFDRAARAAVEPDGEGVVTQLLTREAAFASSEEVVGLRREAVDLTVRQATELANLRERHRVNRADRRRHALARTSHQVHVARASSVRQIGPNGAPSDAVDLLTLRASRSEAQVRPEMACDWRSQQGSGEKCGLVHAGVVTLPARDEVVELLARQSRRDKTERRTFDAAQAAERRDLDARIRRIDRRLTAFGRLRRLVSRRLMQQIHDTYRITNAHDEVRGLRELYAPAEPPGGAGDCAAPKLLACAYERGLRPLAMAEFWWGAPPAGGGRIAGAFYPACRDKCGPLLPFMMEGLDVAAPRRFAAPDAMALELRVVFEDDWIMVVDKPCGLLSVPSRSGRPDDSVLGRLRRRDADVLLVHRLDLDTSGLLVAARDGKTSAALQRQFVGRTVEKRYVAIVQGRVTGECGVIDLPIRVDVDDRPRQIHDPVHGRSAITAWQVSGRQALPVGSAVGNGLAEGTAPAARNGGNATLHTRVAFFPHSGRTHQLRVHAAHPLGLGAPIVGDRLYGHEGGRLMLHAEALTFTHPATGERLTFRSPAPF